MPPPLLLHAYATFATGGPQVRFATIANRLGAAARHVLVAMDGNLAIRERLDPGLDVTVLTPPLRKGDMLANARTLRRALQEVRPHRLLTCNWGSIEWAIANRLPVSTQVHVEDGFGPEERSAQMPRRVWMRRAMLFGHTLVVPSRTLHAIATTQWRLTARYLPNGIDLGRFARPAGWAPNPAPVIGTVAALRPEKNLARLLQAVALVPQATLLVVGDGPDRPALESLAHGLGLAGRVTWAGHTPDPAAFLHRMDVFAMSSDTEQMPISLLEAMAAGLPVAATDVGDTRSILPAEQRPYVTALDPVPLAAALTALLDDPGRRQALGASNRARVAAEFGQDRMIEAWAGLWGVG